MDHDELEAGLSNFYGTEEWFRHPLNRNMLYTEGVRFFADHAGGGAYWFLDIVATELMPYMRVEPFITVEIHVSKNSDAKILATDGGVGDEPPHVLFERDIGWTDCPFGIWKFFLTNDVLLLPSEY